MDTFSARLNAAEGSYFRAEQKNAVQKHMEKLVEQGKLPQSAIESVATGLSGPGSFFMGEEVPLTVIKSRPTSEVIFQYNGTPVPKMSASAAWGRSGTAKVSLGRSRWTADGASIFSVSDGKRLAQTPVKEPTAWELNRARKIANAAVDERIVQGLRLMPEYTPGRAMLWGSILAVWGTAVLTASVARSLDIHNATDASSKLRDVFTPYVIRSKEFFQPLKDRMGAQNPAALQSSLFPIQELAKRMRENLSQRA